ncbi:MAG: hypothetical protein GX552_03570 [Chloroflexi bacterium]|nr:hypothetical protein [Chloroflexota bacterium]
MAGSIRIEYRAPVNALTAKTVELLARRVRERSGVPVVQQGVAELGVALDIAPGIGAEGFRIESEGDMLRIVGNDPRGLLYGVGKFLRDARYAEGDFAPGPWRGTSVPSNPVRGMYFATHFHNFYHDAPLVEVERYVEELALWGCNALSVWFDMHHFTGIADPRAQEMIARLHAILRAANAVGMGAALTTLANEAYANSPVELRAVPNRAHYHVELCPNQPGAVELMLRWRQEMLDAFSDLDIRYLWIWPYDQGGCLCERCAPWGANGFIKMAEPVARLVRATLPNAATVLSTWWFDYDTTGEYEGLWRLLASRPDWVDYLMVDAHGDFPRYPLEHGAPAGIPILNFPEISMYAMYPWGGFGANPLPLTLQARWDASRHLLSGGFPYSEGIYEDMNKAIFFQFYWDPQRPALETVREYAAYEYDHAVADEVVSVVERLEQNHQHGLGATQGEEALDWAATPVYDLPRVRAAAANAEANLAALQGVADRLTPAARNAWRWRVLWLRAALDAEIQASGGRSTARTEEYLRELVGLYYAEQAEAAVRPPDRAFLAQRARQ